MPISIDEFESHDSKGHHTNAERVVRFLAQNGNKAYKAVEIVEATDVNENSMHPVLNRLEEQGFVRHKEPYWAIGDIEAVQDAMMFSSTVEFLDDTLGSESRDEWLRAAEHADRTES